MPTAKAPVVVVEDDPFLRMLGLVLDPATSADRRAAFADFFAHEEPDFEGYCARVRARAGKLYPAEVRLVETESELRANLADCNALVVEAFAVGPTELAVAPQLKAVQRFGLSLRNIDMDACAARGIKVLTLRRRANIACAEHAIGLMLMLARKMRFAGKISVGSSRVDLQACKLEYSIVSPK